MPGLARIDPAVTANCLIGCIDDFTCHGEVPLVLPVNGDNVSPWVKARFGTTGGGGIMEDEIVTVGNESGGNSPDRIVNQFGEPHHASIKSFSYGTTDGHKCTLEIIDEEGGEFFLFVNKLIKCLNTASIQYAFQVQWGWTIQNCDASRDFEASPIVTFLPVNLEASFSDGVIKYNVTGTDMFQVAFAAREDTAFGSDDQKMSLKNATIKMLGENEPKSGVGFWKKGPDGTLDDWKYKTTANGGPDGPKSSWTCDNQNKLATVSRWNQPFRTEDDKGIVAAWDTTSFTPNVILWEDSSLACKEKAECNSGRHIGSFIVNGGACSNVISFTPNINWPAGFAMMAQGGGAGGPTSGEGVKKNNERAGGGTCFSQKGSKAGIMTSVTTQRQGLEANGPAEDKKEHSKSDDAHSQANMGREGIQPIEGELKIQGHPGIRFVSSIFVHQAYVCIVVINPFHLAGPWYNGKGDWMVLADSGCNTVLSNRFWKVMGANHEIKEGSYVTTLKVQLPVPGVSLDPDQPLGTDDFAFRPADDPEGKPC